MASLLADYPGLRSLASAGGPMTFLQTCQIENEASKVLHKIKRLQAVMDAADAFLATPPSDMPTWHHFGQSTTAGDCRELNKAYREAAEEANDANA